MWRAAWPADAQLHDHEVGAVDRAATVRGGDERSTPPVSPEDAAGQTADRVEALRVGVEQHELVDDQPVLVGAERVDQLGGVGAPAAHHGDLGAHAYPTVRTRAGLADSVGRAVRTIVPNVTSCDGVRPSRDRGEPVTTSAAAAALPAVLAVDGGASKTDVWLVGTDGTLLGAARGEGCNHQFSGLDGAMDALGSTIDAALGAAGLDPAVRPAATAGVYCLAGVDLPVDVEQLSGAIAARNWTSVDHLHNDTMAVLRAGVTEGWGVGVVCGSGLNCVGLGADGTVVRFPSLAELSGDFASGGSWLGVRALGLALRARDGRGRPTALAAAVPAHFGLPDPEAVLTGVYTGAIEYGRLFELARVCVEVAVSGDEEASGAVDFLAGEVVAMVNAVIRRLGAARDPVEVVLGGGLFGDEHDLLARPDRGRRAQRGPLQRASYGSMRRRCSVPRSSGSTRPEEEARPSSGSATRHRGWTTPSPAEQPRGSDPCPIPLRRTRRRYREQGRRGIRASGDALDGRRPSRGDRPSAGPARQGPPVGASRDLRPCSTRRRLRSLLTRRSPPCTHSRPSSACWSPASST